MVVLYPSFPPRPPISKTLPPPQEKKNTAAFADLVSVRPGLNYSAAPKTLEFPKLLFQREYSPEPGRCTGEWRSVREFMILFLFLFGGTWKHVERFQESRWHSNKVSSVAPWVDCCPLNNKKSTNLLSSRASCFLYQTYDETLSKAQSVLMSQWRNCDVFYLPTWQNFYVALHGSKTCTESFK